MQTMNALQLSQNAPEARSFPADRPVGGPERSMNIETGSPVSPRQGVRGEPSSGNSSTEEQNENKLSEKRGAMMVVSVLIATLTYQATLNPPGGFWQDNGNSGSNEHVAGTAINVQRFVYHAFVKANAVGLFASLATILFLTSAITIKRPIMIWGLMFIMWVSVFSVAFSFVFGLFLIMRDTMTKTIAVFLLSSMALFAILLILHTAICVKELLRRPLQIVLVYSFGLRTKLGRSRLSSINEAKELSCLRDWRTKP
ncbi:hypothetical protein EJ110_NYTH53180 [Nymphaea thermarum]|nr:hypothetical protein EJ110_NYTH53180 [Nymphaea thermarum]